MISGWIHIIKNGESYTVAFAPNHDASSGTAVWRLFQSYKALRAFLVDSLHFRRAAWEEVDTDIKKEGAYAQPFTCDAETLRIM